VEQVALYLPGVIRAFLDGGNASVSRTKIALQKVRIAPTVFAAFTQGEKEFTIICHGEIQGSDG
jgi:hypothetical protein